MIYESRSESKERFAIQRYLLIIDFKLSPCFEYFMYSFGYCSCQLVANLGPGINITLSSHHPLNTLHPTFEDGTDRGFRNVGKSQPDAGEIPKRIHTILRSNLPRIIDI
jgi:hypothetical protein